MAYVTNLSIEKQSETSNTYFSSWDFDEDSKNVTIPTGVIKKGDLVMIKGTATQWYNGTLIESWVRSHRWYVTNIEGRKVTLGKNSTGTNTLNVAISIGNIVKAGYGDSVVASSTLDHYSIKWSYSTGDGIWFVGTETTTPASVRQSTYTPPENALSIKISVVPVAKKHKVNGKDTYYWTGTQRYATHLLLTDPPKVPPVPTIELNGLKLTVKVENITDPRTDKIEFTVYDGIRRIKTAKGNVNTARSIYSTNVAAGGEYRVRIRAINIYGKFESYSDWTDYSESLTTRPRMPKGFTILRADSKTSIYLKWEVVNNATTYDIEYTTEKRFFGSSDGTTIISSVDKNYYIKTGLEPGYEYFFRIRAVNDKGSSGWSPISSVIIGENPNPPTTWSSSTTLVVGETVILYWIHNSKDGSHMKNAEIEMYVDSVKETHTKEGTIGDDEEETTYSYTISNTSKFTEGTKIEWRVRTSGITNEYSEWSIMRNIDVYAPPTLSIHVTDTAGNAEYELASYPIYVDCESFPKNQNPIGYYLSVISNEAYSFTDAFGKSKYINEGDEIYSKYFDITTETMSATLTPSDIDLVAEISYKVVCKVSMDSGLTAEASSDFKVQIYGMSYEPDAEISFDRETLTTYIKPYCLDINGSLIENMSLSVYRREFDGTYLEIASDLNNTDGSIVIDPHPSLDYARYRIIGIDNTTGVITPYDCPAYPVNESSVIIQWDEEWSTFDTTNEDVIENPPFTTSLLKLPYNIDISDNRAVDVSLVKYIGRKHPVSYYGTQLGETSTWNMEIPKTDVDTLYNIRRLSIWTGDVYVREPSGSGYWANISVSFSQKHKDLTIPITLDVTRVEGGI